jgi:hypothetical protein
VGAPAARVAHLYLAFAIGLVGHGTSSGWHRRCSFTVFGRVQFEERRLAARCCAGNVAAVYGLITGLVVHHLFQDVFLVRLP